MGIHGRVLGKRPAPAILFDGASTTATPPTLSNSNRTASFTLDGTVTTALAAVLSTMTKSTGKWFVEFNITAFGDGTAATSIGLGIAGPTFDPNNILATISDAWTINSSGGSANYSYGALTAPATATGPAPAVPARVGFYFDADLHTMGIVTPDNVQQASAAVLPAEAFHVLFLATASGVSGTFTATIEPTPTLTYPAGHTNAAL
jgi:hypothetical protein